jgi:hypothetical protein
MNGVPVPTVAVVADFDRSYELDTTSLPAQIGKALSYAIERRNADGLRLMREAANRVRERGVHDGEGIYKMAEAFAVLGDQTAALRILGVSIDAGFYPYPWFMADPLLASIRQMPEFQSLMERAQRRYEEFKAQFGT